MYQLATREPVKLIFENRGSLNHKNLQQAFEELYSDQLRSIYQMPVLKHYFPELKFEIVDKRDPGIQCTDFILWSILRKESGKNDWYNRLVKPVCSESRPESGNWVHHNFDLGQGIYELNEKYPFDYINSDRIDFKSIFSSFTTALSTY